MKRGFRTQREAGLGSGMVSGSESCPSWMLEREANLLDIRQDGGQNKTLQEASPKKIHDFKELRLRSVLRCYGRFNLVGNRPFREGAQL